MGCATNYRAAGEGAAFASHLDGDSGELKIDGWTGLHQFHPDGLREGELPQQFEGDFLGEGFDQVFVRALDHVANDGLHGTVVHRLIQPV